jgi:hypothetical protein
VDLAVEAQGSDLRDFQSEKEARFLKLSSH